jgi:hypothetical protein
MSIPTSMDEALAFIKLEFKRIEVGVGFEMTDIVLARGSAEQWQHSATHSIVTNFKSYLYARTVEKWPATWWDAFKDRWFPAWAQKRWPVEWVTLQQIVPTLEAPPGHSPLYIAFGGAGMQRLYPHGERPIALQPYNLKVPIEAIRNLIRYAQIPDNSDTLLSEVWRWTAEYERLTEQ